MLFVRREIDIEGTAKCIEEIEHRACENDKLDDGLELSFGGAIARNRAKMFHKASAHSIIQNKVKRQPYHMPGASGQVWSGQGG